MRPATLGEAPTPALVLDRGIVEGNATRMRARAEHLGVALRPHLKTAKCAQVAALATPGRAATVATLALAEHLASHGYTDLLYAVCVFPGRLRRAAALLDRADLCLITDDVDVARAIADTGAPFRVAVEVDCGEHRTGVAPDAPDLLDIARVLDAGPTRFAGVVTHGGHSYAARGAAIAEVAEQERAAAAHAAERLTADGLPCPIVSVGSTPTATHARDLTGVTEMRPGVYLFGDLFQAAIGSCTRDDIALSVLATVIHVDRTRDRAVLDAGYGLVCALDGAPLDVTVASVHQEHGEVFGVTGLTVGDRVRILPNHACITAAMHDEYLVVDGSTAIVDRWRRVNRW